MNRIAIAALSTSLIFFPSLSTGQQSTPQTSTQNSQDVPHQKPKTNNPDVGKQRQPAPKPHNSEQQKADVPEQTPGTNNPDLAKDHVPSKKSKSKKSTSSSTQ